VYTTDKLISLATDLINSAGGKGILLRLLGGIAFYLHATKAKEVPAFTRIYKDLDFGVSMCNSANLISVFTELGWKEEKEFNALHGNSRMLFFYGENLDLQADVFVENFEQCHNLSFKNSLSADSMTLPLSYLLLTKLQIHELNSKDVSDILMMLYDHDFGLEKKEETEELKTIIDITSKDWGWYTTVTDNLAFIKTQLLEYVPKDDADRLRNTIAWLEKNISEAQKSLKWKLRALIGRRITWYELPEEVDK